MPPDQFGDEEDYEKAMERSIAFAHAGHETYLEAKAIALLDVVCRRVGKPKDLSFLDVGCGVGGMQGFVAPEVGRSVGVEPSWDLIEAARDRHRDSEFVAGSGHELPFGSGEFDVTFAVNVLHHIDPEHRPALVAECLRVTSPGGLFVVFEHNPLNPLTRLAVDRCDFDEGVVLLSRGEVVRLAAAHGAAVVERRFVVFFPTASALARKAEARLGWLPLGAQHMVAMTQTSL